METTLSGLANFCSSVLVLVPYALIVLLPVTFWPDLNNMFDLPKLAVLRALTLLALLAWAIRAAILRRVTFVATPLAKPVLAYGLVLALSTAISQAPLVSLFGLNERQDGLLTQLNFLVLYFLVANTLTSGRQIRRAVEMHVVTATVVATMGIMQYLGIGTLGLAADYWGYRAYGTLGNPDFLGTYLVLALPAALTFLIGAARDRRPLWAIATFLLALALVLSFTRGAWIGAGVSLASLAWLQRHQIWRARYWLLGVGLAILLTAAGTQSQWMDPLRSTSATGAGTTVKPPSVVETSASALRVNQGTAGARLQIWRGTLDLIKDHPVLGTGLNTFMGAFSRYASPEYAADEGMRYSPDKAHNQFLQVAAESGLVGLAAYVWLLVAIGLLVNRGLARRSGRERLMLGGLAAAGLGFLAQGMFLFPVIDTGALSWLIVALMAGLAIGPQAPTAQRPLPAWSRPVIPLAALSVIGLLAVLALKPLVADYLAWQGDRQQQGLHQASGSATAKAAAAADYYRAAIAWHPYDEQYHRRLAVALRVQAAATNDRTRRRELLYGAVLELSAAINIDPQEAGLHFERGFTYQSFGDDYRVDALNDYRHAVRLYPYFYAANRALADLGRQMRRQDEGIIAQLNILALLPGDRQTLLNLGDDYASLGRLDEAVEVWQRVALTEAKDASVFIRLGRVYAARKEYDAARDAFERALTIDPKLEEAQQSLKVLSAGGVK